MLFAPTPVRKFVIRDAIGSLVVQAPIRTFSESKSSSKSVIDFYVTRAVEPEHKYGTSFPEVAREGPTRTFECPSGRV